MRQSIVQTTVLEPSVGSGGVFPRSFFVAIDPSPGCDAPATRLTKASFGAYCLELGGSPLHPTVRALCGSLAHVARRGGKLRRPHNL